MDMAQYESTRLPVARRRAGSETGDGRAELLDLLASGSPPAFASDSRDRIVFWNDGARDLLGKRADEVLGQRCFEAIGGRDVYGNRFCYANCPVLATVRAGDAVCAFEMEMKGDGERPDPLVNVTVLKIPSLREDLFTLVHILQPIEPGARLSRTLGLLGAVPVEPQCAASTSPTPVNAAMAAAAAPEASTPPLTHREVEILRWVAEGLQNKDIAKQLNLSLATVRNHIHNILEKLGVHSKLEAVSLAFRSGWVSNERTAES
jgi:DNA-binding CsgD family transcriptional regulator